MQPWVCRTLVAVLDVGLTGTLHVACGIHCFDGLGGNMLLQLPLDEVVQSPGGLGTILSAELPTVGLTGVKEKKSS